MTRVISNVKATRMFVEQMQKENAELKAALYSVLDYSGGWPMRGLDENHPMQVAWRLRYKLEGRPWPAS